MSLDRSTFTRRIPMAAAVLLAAALLPPTAGFGQDLTDPLNFPGGFLESATTGLARPRLTQTAIQALLPARGPFLFPVPYATAGSRITNASDCGGGDCVLPAGYSYWRNMNNHVGQSEILILLGLSRARGGQGPTLFRYDKASGQVINAGPLFDASSGKSGHSTEGWYFSATRPTTIYVDDGPRMLRYDVSTRQFQTVFDVAPQYGSDKYLWQMHSSDDDRVHSATLRTSTDWSMLGCVVYSEDTRRFQYFPAIGEFNECHVDKSGRWLMSLEDLDGKNDLEMRIFDLADGSERMIWDQDGAVGHADMGHGYVIGADNWNSMPSAILLWDFAGNPLSGRMVFHSPNWTAPAANHISHTNARPGVAASEQVACGSAASRATGVWGNEIVCFGLDDSMDVLVVAPVLTDLDASGGGDDYAKMPKGNLDVTGRYFLWTSNAGGSRLDAFLVKVPSHLLGGSPSDPPPPADTTPPAISSVAATGVSSSGATIGWTTGEPADTQVEFGTTTAYGSLTSIDAALVTAHARALVGLTAGTPYHYRVRSRDAAGNLATSGDFTFTTAAATPPSGGAEPAGVWTLDEGTGTVAADGSGNGFAGALVNGPSWTAGVSGSAVALDGADDCVDVPHAAALNAYPLSLAFWVKTGATGLHGVVNKYVASAFNGYQVYVNGGNLCAWYMRDASNAVWDGTACTLMTAGVTDNAWHHVVFVVDASGGRLYVDGASRASRAWTGTPGAVTTTTGLSFGRYPGVASPYLPGAIDDVRLYARALAADEVAALSGSVDRTAPVITSVAASGISSSGATITWTTGEASDSQIEFGTTTAYGSLTPPDGGLVTAHSGALGGLTAGTLYHYRVRSRDAAGNVATSGDFTFTTLTAAVPPPSGPKRSRPIGHWKLNDATGALAADGSGNGFSGALKNGPAWTAGVLGPALSFDGVDDYVEIAHAAALNAYPLSLVFWVRTTATGLHGVVNKYVASAFDGYQVYVNGGSLCAWYMRDAANAVWDGTSCTLKTGGVTDGGWHHVALAVDDAGGRLYVDGELRASRGWTGTPGPATTAAGLSIGRYPGVSAPHLPGAIDDVRVYPRALGEEEIHGLYSGAAW